MFFGDIKMRLHFKITFDGLGVSKPLRQHVIEQFNTALCNFDEQATLEVVLRFNPHADKGSRNTVTVTTIVDKKTPFVRSSTCSSGMYASISDVTKKVAAEIVQMKEKRVTTKVRSCALA